METCVIVRPGHLNHHGYLFGGQLLKWVDEYAWIAASRDYAGKTLVTRAMDTIDFKQRVKSGAILRFDISEERKGKTSVTYMVKVYSDEQGAAVEREVFSTHVTFVCLDESGDKCSICCE